MLGLEGGKDMWEKIILGRGTEDADSVVESMGCVEGMARRPAAAGEY